MVTSYAVSDGLSVMFGFAFSKATTWASNSLRGSGWLVGGRSPTVMVTLLLAAGASDDPEQPTRDAVIAAASARTVAALSVRIFIETPLFL